MNRALSKLLLAVAILVSATLLPYPAQSLTCCDRCRNNVNACYASCGGNTACQTNCDNAYTNCAMGCFNCPF